MTLVIPSPAPDLRTVEDIKADVVRIARDYAVRHDLCGVVEEALAEANVLPVNDTDYIPINVLVRVEAKVGLQVRASAFEGLTEAEVHAKVARLLMDQQVNDSLPQVNVDTKMPSAGHDIAYLAEADPGQVQTIEVLDISNYGEEARYFNGTRIPDGLVVRRYASHGAINHLLYEREDGDYDSAVARCGRFGLIWEEASQYHLCMKCQRIAGMD